MFIEDWYSNNQCNELIKLVELVKELKGTIIEIGCWEGKSTSRIANSCFPENVVCNDTWLGNIAESNITGITHTTELILKERDVYSCFLNNMNQLTKGNYIVIKKDCLEWLKEFKEPIKFIHIDASHEYESVYETIRLCLPNIVKGGIICGDDFLSANINRHDLHGGVERAVRELLPNFRHIDNLWYYINNETNLLNPITFSIPEEKIINYIPDKTKILSSLIPGKNETYIYNTESEYYEEYRQSMFATTRKKAGWDCMRHYEIIANGSIPYFPDIEQCPPNTMALFPKNLVIEGNLLYDKFKNKNMNELTSDDMNEYNELAIKILEYTKENLSTKKMAEYMLQKTNNKNVKKILYLSSSTFPDYLRCVTLHGFKEIFGSNCHDVPKIPHLYKSTDINYSLLYGKGISYTDLLENSFHNDELDKIIEDDIKNKAYDIVIYGSYHRGMPYYDLVSQYYEANKIILMCGEDFA